jgi:hypothetical protein
MDSNVQKYKGIVSLQHLLILIKNNKNQGAFILALTSVLVVSFSFLVLSFSDWLGVPGEDDVKVPGVGWIQNDCTGAPKC